MLADKYVRIMLRIVKKVFWFEYVLLRDTRNGTEQEYVIIKDHACRCIENCEEKINHVRCVVDKKLKPSARGMSPQLGYLNPRVGFSYL